MSVYWCDVTFVYAGIYVHNCIFMYVCMYDVTFVYAGIYVHNCIFMYVCMYDVYICVCM